MDDLKKINKEEVFSFSKLVYGPVKSWRFGESLGIDPIFTTSTCSFNCIYCQLGNIQDITNTRKKFVETSQIIIDLKELLLKDTKIDVITFSGSGEPTLATNLEDMIDAIKEICPNTPQYILTNATTLSDKHVRNALMKLDKVIIKLDAGTSEMYEKINRPVDGLTLDSIIQGIEKFRKEYKGEIEVQTMFMPMNKNQLEEYAKKLIQINPDIVQLNTPKRAYPLSWQRENRGNHLGYHDHETRTLKVVSLSEAKNIEEELIKMTNLKFVSIYRE